MLVAGTLASLAARAPAVVVELLRIEVDIFLDLDGGEFVGGGVGVCV